MNISPKASKNAFRLFITGLSLLAYEVDAQTNCVTPPNGLVSWWRGENNASDSVGGNNGVFLGAAFKNGEVNEAFSFNVSGNNILVPASNTLDVGAGGGLSIEGWINSTDNTYGRPIAEWVSPTVGGYEVHFFVHQTFPGTLYANLYDTSGNEHRIQSAPDLVKTNVFQHVALTYDKASGVGRLYVNGVVVQESALGTFTPQTSSKLSIGYRPSTVPFGPIPFLGLIDELSLYSRALTPSEVQSIYQAGSAGKCTETLNQCDPAPADRGSMVARRRKCIGCGWWQQRGVHKQCEFCAWA